MSGFRYSETHVLSEQSRYFTPWTIDTLKVIALLAMIIDHANILLGFQEDYLRMIGRCAFPLFGIIWAFNFARIHDDRARQKSINRLWIWALATQPLYYYALKDKGLDWHNANILLCFAGAGQAIHWIKKESITWVALAVVTLLFTIYLTERSEYGARGMAFLVISYGYFALTPKTTLAHASWLITLCISVAILNPSRVIMAMSGTILTVAVLAAVFSLRERWKQRYLPPRMFYYAYGGHISLFSLIA